MLWKIIWILFALAVTGYCGWTLQVILNQKKAWRAFAKKYKLKYMEEGMFSPPGMFGKIGGQAFVAYIESSNGFSFGQSGSWTVLEMPFESELKTAEITMVSTDFMLEMQQADWLQSFVPDHPAWGDNTPLYSETPDFFKNYLDDEKITSLARLKSAPKAGYIFMVDQEGSVVSYRTRQPLDDPKQINEAVKIIRAVVDAWQKPSKARLADKKFSGTLAFEDDDEDKAQDQNLGQEPSQNNAAKNTEDEILPQDNTQQDNKSINPESGSDKSVQPSS